MRNEKAYSPGVLNMCENDWPPINMPASQRCAPDGSKGIGRLGRFARVIPYRVRRQAGIDPRGCRATCHGECGRLELIGICQINRDNSTSGSCRCRGRRRAHRSAGTSGDEYYCQNANPGVTPFHVSILPSQRCGRSGIKGSAHQAARPVQGSAPTRPAGTSRSVDGRRRVIGRGAIRPKLARHVTDIGEEVADLSDGATI